MYLILNELQSVVAVLRDIDPRKNVGHGKYYTAIEFMPLRLFVFPFKICWQGQFLIRQSHDDSFFDSLCNLTPAGRKKGDPKAALFKAEGR